MLGYLLTLVGLVTCVTLLIKLVGFVRETFFVTCDMKKKYAKAGDWAVVTGATEGIGRAMALELGRRGFNVCVIARTQARLDELCTELQRMNVKGIALSFDFANATSEKWAELFRELDGLEISVLINNVGVNYTYPQYFDEVPIEEDLRILRVNCEATMRMTKYVVPKMRLKRAGAVVCLSSFSAVTPTPLLATYAGTKAFNSSFGQGLACELKEFGIDVLVVSPNVVISRMTQGTSAHKPRETFSMVSADQMARQTLNRLGCTLCSAGHRNHVLIESIIRCIPYRILLPRTVALMKSVKRRAERRMNKAE